MKVSMIGAGYVGLVSGACFADFGHTVTCVDRDPARVEALQAGRIPIYEPGLEQLVANNVLEGRLRFAVDMEESVADADAVFIAVGTPSRRGDGFADLSYVYAAAQQIARALRRYTVVVDKSTVPVGTAHEVQRLIREIRPDAEFSVASNPEFLREGAAISDFKRPDRIVVGVEDERAKDVIAELYRPLFLNETPIMFTDLKSAELIKYASNAFLAMKITFINEMADLCEQVGADVQKVARGIGLDRRIGEKFLNAGPGYGGSCFPKDTLALARTAAEADAPSRLVEAVVAINEDRKRSLAMRVARACGGNLDGKLVAVLGLAFKPNTDDMRESPSIDLITGLQAKGARIQAFDPAAMEEAKKVMTNVDYKQGPYDALENADIAVIVTEWDQFRALDLSRVRRIMRGNCLVDFRNIYAPADVRGHGLVYLSLGRP